MTERENLAKMLTQRGITNADFIVGALEDSQLDGAMGAILWWDSMPQVGTRAVSKGLLVNKVREGLPGYRAPAERSSPEGSMISEALLVSVRGVLLSPDGFDRDEGGAQFAAVARRLAMPVADLIDAAVGPQWTCTPPHPAVPQGWTGGWVAKDAYVGLRYRCCAVIDQLSRPDPKCTRASKESDWDWACRFWGWTDPQEITDLIAKAEQVKLDASAAAARLDKQMAAEAAAEAELAAVAAENDAW